MLLEQIQSHVYYPYTYNINHCINININTIKTMNNQLL